MRRPWLLAAALAVAAVGVAAVALIHDRSAAEANPPGFPDNPQGRKPLIFDVGLVKRLADRVVVLEGGRVKDVGRPDEVDIPVAESFQELAPRI